MVVAVDSRNTSRRCFVCGHVAKENRESQAVLLCVACGPSVGCGHMDNADVNAAINIRNAAFPHLVSTGGLPGLDCGSNLGGGRKQEIHETILGSSVLQGREQSLDYSVSQSRISGRRRATASMSCLRV